MKQLFTPLFVIASIVATPTIAEDSDSGSSLMERGAELFWEGLRKEMAPSLEELEGLMATIGPAMQNFLTEMGPALADIAEQVEDWSRYEAPEILPNGDIIIRRKPETPEAPNRDDDAGESGATDI